MTKVTTELDARFSDPGAEATSWEEAERALEAAQLFWITTVRRDGRPHVTPLVAVWSSGALHFCTGPEEQKAVNLGEAERVTDAARLAELAATWEGKWDGQWKFRPVAEGFEHDESEGIGYVFAVRPTKVRAFGKSPFSHTRHLFPAASG